jgi:ABC-type Fe3+ transport system substrate-binding protein
MKTFPPIVAGLLAVALALLHPAEAAERTVFEAAVRESGRLALFSTTDLTAMRPIIEHFQKLRPDLAIDYVDALTNELYDAVSSDGGWEGLVPDVVISSAMDLQVKLVNDGFAQPHKSAETARLPDWANWRNEAFGFTFEPAVIVYNPRTLPPEDIPSTRFDLVNLLREKSSLYQGRIATYDIAQSGVGYLFATQDARQAHTFGRLIESFGRNAVRLSCCTADVLQAIEDGRVLIGYNLLGSYTRNRILRGASLVMVLPRDYALVMSRVAFIHRHAPNVAAARAFLDYLLSLAGQGVLARESSLYSVHPDLSGPGTAEELNAETEGPLRPINLGPGLLVYLDRMKRQRFLDDWRTAMGSNRVDSD